MMKEIYFEIYDKYKSSPDFDLPENIEISINDIIYSVVHFESDCDFLIVRYQSGGGILSLVELSDNMKYFIYAVYSRYQKIQNFEGDEMAQNLDYSKKAMKCAKKYITSFKNMS